MRLPSPSSFMLAMPLGISSVGLTRKTIPFSSSQSKSAARAGFLPALPINRGRMYNSNTINKEQEALQISKVNLVTHADNLARFQRHSQHIRNCRRRTTEFYIVHRCMWRLRIRRQNRDTYSTLAKHKLQPE